MHHDILHMNIWLPAAPTILYQYIHESLKGLSSTTSKTLTTTNAFCYRTTSYLADGRLAYEGVQTTDGGHSRFNTANILLTRKVSLSRQGCVRWTVERDNVTMKLLFQLGFGELACSVRERYGREVF